MKDVGGAVLAGSTPPFNGFWVGSGRPSMLMLVRSAAALATMRPVESVKENSATVLEPRCVWLRVLIFKDLEKARRLPVRVEEQQAQQLGEDPLYIRPEALAMAGKKSS